MKLDTKQVKLYSYKEFELLDKFSLLKEKKEKFLSDLETYAEDEQWQSYIVYIEDDIEIENLNTKYFLEDIHKKFNIAEDMLLKEIIWFGGDVTINGTFSTSSIFELVGIVIEGNLKVKNFINMASENFFLAQKMYVSSLAFLGMHGIDISKTLKVKDLIYYDSIYCTYPSSTKYENRFNFSTNGYKLFDKKFYGKENGVTTFYFLTLIESLEKNESYLDPTKLEKLARKKAYEEEAKQKRIEEESVPYYHEMILFKYDLESYETDNMNLAGFEFVDSEKQIKKLGLYYPEDQLLRDIRSESGLYALIHANLPRYIKPNKTKKEGFEVEAFVLLNRYRDLKGFIMESHSMYYEHIFDSFKGKSIIDVYESEKHSFKTDKELALYWLIVFGLLEKKKKFKEIVKSSQHFEWDRIVGAVQYFKQKEYLKIINAEEKIKFLREFKVT